MSYTTVGFGDLVPVG
ncbi:hypothetical protein [Nitrosospira multiformis]|nr:hypothetical protein [Nitrosospira multiformis]